MLNSTTFSLKLSTINLTRDELIEEINEDGYRIGRVDLSRVINRAWYPGDKLLNHKIEAQIDKHLNDIAKDLLFTLDFDLDKYRVEFTVNNTMLVINKETRTFVGEYMKTKGGYDPVDR